MQFTYLHSISYSKKKIEHEVILQILIFFYRLIFLFHLQPRIKY